MFVWIIARVSSPRAARCCTGCRSSLRGEPGSGRDWGESLKWHHVTEYPTVVPECAAGPNEIQDLTVVWWTLSRPTRVDYQFKTHGRYSALQDTDKLTSATVARPVGRDWNGRCSELEAMKAALQIPWLSTHYSPNIRIRIMGACERQPTQLDWQYYRHMAKNYGGPLTSQRTDDRREQH